ncbi:DUF1294 domain-containing protein [Roseovarius aestuarii]|nr:DUF1294 domain-containing protein [Roseovarius aestuarii]
MQTDPTGTVLIATGGYLVVINILAWLAFSYDKDQSRIHGWRIPERRLLLLALLGGWPAAKLAQHRLRHKTRKQPFAHRLNMIVMAWVLWLILMTAMKVM